MKMRALGLLFFLAVSPAMACRVAPKQLSATPDELIARTTTIALATVVRAEMSGRDVLYTFRTIRAIKGKSENEFQLRAEAALYPAQNNDFEGHSQNEFWSHRIGRASMDTDCKVHPSFSVGGTYLAFLDQPFHAKSFELIRVTTGDRQDKWLKYVLTRVGP